jgi:hypothetical protein
VDSSLTHPVCHCRQAKLVQQAAQGVQVFEREVPLLALCDETSKFLDASNELEPVVFPMTVRMVGAQTNFPRCSLCWPNDYFSQSDNSSPPPRSLNLTQKSAQRV